MNISKKQFVIIFICSIVFLHNFSFVCFCAEDSISYETNPVIGLYVTRPISSIKILPNTLKEDIKLLNNTTENIINIKGCRGEYEPGSFVINSNIQLSKINIVSTDLIGKDGSVIPKDSVDVRTVKCWYQSGFTIGKSNKILVPELLLKDDSLVFVDRDNEINYLRVHLNDSDKYIDVSSADSVFPDGAEIHDSETFIPFDLKDNENKQIWITVKIPKDAASGKYDGKILISSGEFQKSIQISVDVYPFDLVSSAFEYGLYYVPFIVDNVYGKEFAAQYKTKEQYYIELKNIQNHGIMYPTLYQRIDNPKLLREALSIRKSLGFSNDKIYTMALGVNTNLGDPGVMSRIPGYIENWKTILGEYGYKDFYIYGMDEASGETLIQQRPAWEIIHSYGAKIFAASNEKSYSAVGDILDLPVLAGIFNQKEVKKWHNNGKKIFIYANPQSGIENSYLYRRNYGIEAYCNGYDGMMNFAYQYDFKFSKGHIYNDFSNTTNLRNHVFAYPTTNGVLDTIQWEGLREGIDDVKYLSTLISNGIKGKCTNFESDISTYGDLDLMRAEIANEILSDQSSAKSPELRSIKSND